MLVPEKPSSGEGGASGDGLSHHGSVIPCHPYKMKLPLKLKQQAGGALGFWEGGPQEGMETAPILCPVHFLHLAVPESGPLK